MTTTTIARRYLLESELGSGGMGTVYRATDQQTSQTVAIKELNPNLTDAALIERFKREGEALRQLNHPNIVKMLGTIEEDGHHYLVMEYVSGGDLRALIENQGKLDHRQCVNMAIDLANALTRAHRLNIIHRDLKPANVLIDDTGVLRLTDFGVAHIGSKRRVTNTDAVIGTVDYLAPEALNGIPIDTRTDIWAFGVMLFEMLAGEHPFQASSIAETITTILTAPIPDLELLAPEAPTDLVDLVYHMLERDKQARISSVRHVGATLEDIQHGRDSTPFFARFDTPGSEINTLSTHNLPAQPTPFVGREYELAEINKLITNSSVRLITIIAPGGMGKTRLSLEAAERSLALFGNNVYFVELAPLSDASNIPSAIANALGFQFQGDGQGMGQKQQLLQFLKNKRMLLVLDNFEHLLESASFVTEILNEAPELQILATSRQRLNQPGEAPFHISGMDFPDWETPEDAMAYASVKLFLSSAGRAQPGFELSSNNLDYIVRICRLVQGMPLGIVLAASWLVMLKPREIADEIQQGIDFLVAEGGEVPDRQQSIHVVFRYSWQQMTEAEQQVFMKLSTFMGGFTRDAAQEVAAANLRTLMGLINKSLLRRAEASGRYQVHELLRQFAHHKLIDSLEFQQVKQGHATYFANMAAQADAEFHSEKQHDWRVALEKDHDNIRAALRYSFEDGDPTDGMVIIASLWHF